MYIATTVCVCVCVCVFVGVRVQRAAALFGWSGSRESYRVLLW